MQLVLSPPARASLATAERRDGLDTELRAAEGKLATLPAIALADPQATTAAEILAWLSAGAFKPAPGDISRLRALGLALTPSMAGLLAMLAISLTQAIPGGPDSGLPLLGALLFGAAAGMARERSESIAVSILLHWIGVAAVLLAPYLGSLV